MKTHQVPPKLAAATRARAAFPLLRPAQTIEVEPQGLATPRFVESEGRPLPPALLPDPERHLRHDLSWVRVHADADVAAPLPLRIGEANDPEERHAHQIVRQVLRGEGPRPAWAAFGAPLAGSADVHERQAEWVAGCLDTSPRIHQPNAVGAPASLGAAVVRRGGELLPPSTRAFFEGFLGHDFGGVRVHVGAGASATTSLLSAAAYTAGQDITFAEGRYDPQSTAGRRLLAHELTHVIQQTSRAAPPGLATAAGPAVQFSLDSYVAAMNKRPEPDWQKAALHLNGESPAVITEILAKLGSDVLRAKIHRAALPFPGSDSNIAKMTRADYLRVFPEEAAARAKEEREAAARAAAPPAGPKPTPEDEYADRRAYASAMRDERLEKRAEAARKDLPGLSAADFNARWKTDKAGLIAAAQKPNHGIKADALVQIWGNYWGERHDLAEKARLAIAQSESGKDPEGFLRKLAALEDGDRSAFPGYAEAATTEALGELMLRHGSDALTSARFADAEGKSLTIDELTERVRSFAAVHDPLVTDVEMALTLRGMIPGRPPAKTNEAAKNAPVKNEPTKNKPPGGGDRPSGVYPKANPPPTKEPTSQAVPKPVEARAVSGDTVVVGQVPVADADVPRGSAKPPNNVVPIRPNAVAGGGQKPPPAPSNPWLAEQQKKGETKPAANARNDADRQRYLKSGREIDVSKVADFEKHHVATKYGAVGEANLALFENADIPGGIEGDCNKVSIEGHEGPHGRDYNDPVHGRLKKSVQGKVPHTEAYREAFLEELAKIKGEVAKKGSDLNDLVTRKP